MSTTEDFVSSCATIFTIGLFSSGILTVRKIHASKSVGVIPHLPFVAALMNCSLWLDYGLIKPDYTISLVNSVGVVLQLSYITVYHIYTENKYVVRRDFLGALSIIVTVVIYSQIIQDYTVIMSRLGLICNFFTIFFFASPLSTMAEVIRLQTTESMSLPLSVMSFLTTFSWTSYGFLINDVYVMFPNFVGLLLSLVQLSLFLLYSNKKKTISLEYPA